MSENPVDPSEPSVQLLDSLASADLFAKLNRDQLTRLAQIGEVASFNRGDHVFREGDDGNHFYLICEGAIRVSRTIPGMGEEAFAVLKPGSIFGEMAVFDDSTRSADAVVHEACKLFTVEKEAFRQLLAHNRLLASEVLWQLVRLLSRRLRSSNDKLAFFSVCGRFE